MKKNFKANKPERKFSSEKKNPQTSGEKKFSSEKKFAGAMSSGKRFAASLRGEKIPREKREPRPTERSRSGNEKNFSSEKNFSDAAGYVYGRRAVMEAISSGRSVEKIFVLYGTSGDSLDEVKHAARKEKIPVVERDKTKFADLERNANAERGDAQGVIALVSMVDFLSLDEIISRSFAQTKNPILVALDEITDTHNLGAIARSVECCGAQGIILPEHNAAPVTPGAIKSSAGALEHLPIAKGGNFINALEQLKGRGFWIVGTDMDADHIYTENLYDRPIVLVTGSEGKGMRPSTKKHCDILVKIPLKGKISSLNASVATGVVLFEIMRQREVGDE